MKKWSDIRIEVETPADRLRRGLGMTDENGTLIKTFKERAEEVRAAVTAPYLQLASGQ